MAFLQPSPARSLVAEREAFRMQDLGEDLEGLDQPRTRTIEVGVAVGQVDPAGCDGSQHLPLRVFEQRGQEARCSAHLRNVTSLPLILED